MIIRCQYSKHATNSTHLFLKVEWEASFAQAHLPVKSPLWAFQTHNCVCVNIFSFFYCWYLSLLYILLSHIVVLV